MTPDTLLIQDTNPADLSFGDGSMREDLYGLLVYLCGGYAFMG